MTAGQRREDGTIYLGFKKGKDWFATPQDALDNNGNRLFLNFNQAAQYAMNLEAHGHFDWKMPDADVADLQYDMRKEGDFKGTYCLRESRRDPDGFLSGRNGVYLASHFQNQTRLRSFANGKIIWNEHSGFGSFRPVRAEPRP